MLAAHLKDEDVLGQWMAHHLAELIIVAKDADTSVEQRQQIVSTILEVWAHRRSYPRRLLDDFSAVLTALDRLGDDRPCRFSRIFDDFDDSDAGVLDNSTGDLPLVEQAVELERLTRDTLIHLLWRAARDASVKNDQWLSLADQLASNMETTVTQSLWRLHLRRATADQPASEPENQSGEGDVDGDESIGSEAQANRLRRMA
ncbi:hypothetical protein ACFXG4_17855 [Nocardia sp. NPDC059246]|uniref:hypothetical protein n=1 Tax=unclassified Nocardia TaxID=2637762 RepID=UPI0036D025A6